MWVACEVRARRVEKAVIKCKRSSRGDLRYSNTQKSVEFLAETKVQIFQKAILQLHKGLFRKAEKGAEIFILT
jgi:hypothetical protein